MARRAASIPLTHDQIAVAGDLHEVIRRAVPATDGPFSARVPLATPAAVANELAPFPVKTAAEPFETCYDDWRERLRRNLSRRSDGRWEPLTRIHGAE